MKLSFTKMQGAGNDFVMINAYDKPFELTLDQIRRLCDRKFGVGCDQLLVVEKSACEGVDFKYRIFNCDGAEVEMCGNGARCFAVFVRAQGLTNKTCVRCETMKGIIEPEVMPDARVRVNMGAPSFDPASLPFDNRHVARLSRFKDYLYQIRAGGEDNWVSIVSMGNPHAVKLVGDVASADVCGIGAAFQALAEFPRQVNVGFLQILDRTHAKLRVYERGAGETLACGSGACAAVVAGIRRGALDAAVEVEMAGGHLLIEWAGLESEQPQPVYLTGPAEIVFDGEIDIA